MRNRVGWICQNGTLGKNETGDGKLESTARKIESHAVKLDFTVRQNETERANTKAPISNANATVSKTSSLIVKIRRPRQTRNAPRQIRIGRSQTHKWSAPTAAVGVKCEPASVKPFLIPGSLDGQRVEAQAVRAKGTRSRTKKWC